MPIIAAVARRANADFELAQVELDAPRADEILVRVHGVGICHTDIACRDQNIPTALPVILGHEGSGVVEAVGSDVKKIKPGDRVILTWRTCGTCHMCKRGEPSYCQDFAGLNLSGKRPDGSCTVHQHGQPVNASFFSQSSFAQYAIAYERSVVKVPDGVPLHLMGPLACGFQTGAGSTMNSMACRAGSSIVILGGGSVGLSAMLGAIVQGCTTVIVSEPTAERRALALQLGATHVIDPKSEDLTAAIRAILPTGVDYAFDTTARGEVIQAALNAMASRGTLGLVGVPPSLDVKVGFTLAQLMGLGLTVRGIANGDSDPHIFIPRLIELFRQGRMPFDKLIKTYRLEEINQAIHDQHSGKTVKAVLLTDAVAR
jgi:aryl-alcohol dehydrogenase